MRAACLGALLAGCHGGAGGFRVLARYPGPVACAVVSGDTVWVGAGPQGLAALPLAGGPGKAFGAEAGLKDNLLQVRWIAPGREGLWLATAGGVALFDPARGMVVRSWTARDGLGSDSVRWVGEGRGGVWAGTIAGASRRSPGAARWKAYTTANGLPQNHVYRMLDDGTSLWAACMMGGLARFDPGRNRFAAVPQERGLGNKYLYAMEAAPGRLWLGSAAGLNLYDTAKASWVESVTADGFTDYAVRAVAVAGDEVWFGTAYGLYRRNLATGAQDRWTAGHGLPDDDVVALARSADGSLVVATRTSVLVRRPPRP